MNALNVYQPNIFQILRFMHKQKLNKNPKIFVNSFNKIEHNILQDTPEIIINSQN